VYTHYIKNRAHILCGIGCGTDTSGRWVGVTISWAAAGVYERTTVKYGDRGVWYVYIAAARPACRIMGVPRGVLPSQLCVRGLGSCARALIPRRKRSPTHLPLEHRIRKERIVIRNIQNEIRRLSQTQPLKLSPVPF